MILQYYSIKIAIKNSITIENQKEKKEKSPPIEKVLVKEEIVKAQI